MRRAARTDANQTAIVSALRAMGCSVFVVSSMGRGFPDLAAGFDGMNFLLEVKDGSKTQSEQRLTPDERRFFDTWGGQVNIVTHPHQACELVALLRRRYAKTEKA
jgi:hypothetical protein